MLSKTTMRLLTALLAFGACGTSCAPDDPLTLNQKVTTEPPTTTQEPEANTQPTSTTTTTSTTSSTTTTTTTPPVLTAEYAWGERSEGVRSLQLNLSVEPDGIYGPVTRTAHVAALETAGLPTEDVPAAPARSAPARTFDDVPAPVLASIQNLWPESEWNRALTVAFCESGFRVDAANPTSSARGVFQLLAPWRRDPGTGRTVWGWEYTEDGEKLSAAAGLGISEADATWTVANITVAHHIWQSSGWSPWNASRHCWG